MRIVIPIDRVDELAHLVDQAAHQRSMGLLLIPRAPVRRPQPGHRRSQIVNRAHARTLPTEHTEYTEKVQL